MHVVTRCESLSAGLINPNHVSLFAIIMPFEFHDIYDRSAVLDHELNTPIIIALTPGLSSIDAADGIASDRLD